MPNTEGATFSVLLESYLSHREMRSLLGKHRQWDAVLDENVHLEELAKALDAIVAKATATSATNEIGAIASETSA